MTFNIPRSWPVLVLEDSEDRISWFRQRLHNVEFAKTSAAAISLISQHNFKAVFLDHDLHWTDAGFPERQHGNGKEVARFLRIYGFQGQIVIHSVSDQAAAMAKILPQAKVCRFGDFDITECAE